MFNRVILHTSVGVALATAAALVSGCAKEPLQAAVTTFSTQQVAAVLQMMSADETERATVDDRNALSSEAHAFTAKLVKDETAEKLRLAALLKVEGVTPAQSAESLAVSQASDHAKKDLTASKTIALDRTYAEQEVKTCQDELTRIDRDLLPNARNSALTKHLNEVVKPAIQARLDAARQLTARISQLETLSDSSVASVVDAISAEQVSQASTAVLRGFRPEVRRFASRVEGDQSSARKSMKTTLAALKTSPAQEPALDEVLHTARISTEAINGAPIPQLDRQYIATEESELDGELKDLDSRLIPAAKSPELRRALRESVRPRVEADLKLARDLRKKTDAAPAAPASSAKHRSG